MSRRNDNRFLVEWSDGGQEMVPAKSVVNPENKDLKVGDVMTVSRKGEPLMATLISRAKERNSSSPKMNDGDAGHCPKLDDEPRDFSPSGESSWEPSDDDQASADSDQESRKKIKLENSKRQYVNRKTSKKILTPSHRANAVIPNMSENANSKKIDAGRKRAHNGISRNGSFNKSLSDSTKRHNTSEVNNHTVTIDVRELAEISNSFRTLFNMIGQLKQPMANTRMLVPTYSKNTHANETHTVIRAKYECNETEEFENEEEFNRSDDNVLITNKHDNECHASAKKQVKTATVAQEARSDKRDSLITSPWQNQNVTNSNAGQKDWVPIGSGQTLIHVDQFKKVNWNSYTVATRTLLLAVFPRRILATHSMTGKPSPAFMNKPAKMCLDPKIISDVVMEVTDRFHVKENLVRSIITTKCADEAKMWKQRAKKKVKSRSSSDQENDPPANSFEQSQTAC